MKVFGLDFPPPETPPPTVAPNVWLRNPQMRKTAAWLVAGSVLSFSLIFSKFLPGVTHDQYPVLVAVGFSVGITELIVAYGLASSGLRISNTEIVIRNFLRTRRVSISEVGWFEPGFGSDFNIGVLSPILESILSPILESKKGVLCPILESNQGPLAVEALSKAKSDEGDQESLRQLQPLCDELNALLSALGHGEAPAPREIAATAS